MRSISAGGGLSKSQLLLELWGFRSRFLRRIRRSIFNGEQAEDIFQEACLKFLASPAVFHYPQAATRYFCRILGSLTVNHLRQAVRLEYRESLPEMACDPQADWESGILLDRVRAALRNLPAGDQHLLATFLSPDLGRLRDKCNALHLPSSTMRYRMEKAVSRLRAMVGEDS